MRKYDDPRLMEADKLAAMGRDRAAREPGLYDRLVDATNGEDVAILCTTSGTTAHPKLAMLAAGRVLRHCATYLAFDPKGPDDEYVSVLPLPWIMEQVYVLGKGLLCRMKVNFVEQPDTMMNDFREIAPTFVLFAPRVWESIAADVRAGVMDSSPLKQSLYETRHEDGAGGARARQAFGAGGHAAVPRAARPARLHPAALGGDRRRGARPRHLQILPGHGRAAAHAVRPDRNARRLHAAPGGRGRSRHHRRGDGRQTSRSASRIRTSTASARSWCATPTCSSATTRTRKPPPPTWKTAGCIPAMPAISTTGKQLVVIDRIKDLAETARGERFSPQYIENKLKFSPYIAETVVLGAGREALAAMICIRFSIISKWAEKNRISFTTYTDLASRPEVYALLQQGSRGGQRHAAAGAAHLALPAALQGTRRRRRRTDPHPKGPPQRHQREIRRHHRRHLWRQARASPSTP